MRRALVFALALASCAPSLGRPFMQDRAAAERAYSAGRYDEAADRWLAAEKHATRRRDRLEARYRAAASLRRAGRHAEASKLLESLLAERPHSARAARAAFDHADIEIEYGNREQGYALLERAIESYPRSGVALGALGRVAGHVEERDGVGSALAYLDRARKKAASPGLAELAQYRYAKELELLGRHEDALREYLAQADRFPYPKGALWDDALWSASLLEEKLGRVTRAILHLEHMLAEREPSSMGGSYSRPRYAPARYRIAELYRDRLGDKPRARQEFHRVWDDHPTSLLRDDALWNAARLERDAGDQDAACTTLRTLATGQPDSRYVPCANALCPVLPSTKTKCHPYVLRALESGAERPE